MRLSRRIGLIKVELRSINYQSTKRVTQKKKEKERNRNIQHVSSDPSIPIDLVFEYEMLKLSARSARNTYTQNVLYIANLSVRV